MVADGIIPGNGTIEPGGLKGHLIVYVGGAKVVAGTGCNILAIHDIDKPAEFVELRRIAIVAEHHAEIERALLVQRIDRPDRGIEVGVYEYDDGGFRVRKQAISEINGQEKLVEVLNPSEYFGVERQKDFSAP